MSSTTKIAAGPGPVTDGATIATLLGVVGLCWVEENPDEAITFENIMIEVRDLLAAGQTITDEDVRRGLSQHAFFIPTGGGWTVEMI